MAKPRIVGSEHWTRNKGADLYLWRKRRAGRRRSQGTVILAHSSSMASTPNFDLRVKGRAGYSLMDHLAERDYDVWCFDFEGYGRSTKTRNVISGIARGADDLLAATKAVRQLSKTRSFHLYGLSSGALRAALFAQRHPKLVKRIILDAFRMDRKRKPHPCRPPQKVRRGFPQVPAAR